MWSCLKGLDGDINITKIGNENYNFSGKANIIDGKFYDNQGNIFHNTYEKIYLNCLIIVILNTL